MPMTSHTDEQDLSRRDFVKIAAVGSMIAAMAPLGLHKAAAQEVPQKPKTNGKDALQYSRSPRSMPGAFPGRVVQAYDEKAVGNGTYDVDLLNTMLSKSMLALTGASSLSAAWQRFVEPDQTVGIKVNPVAGKQLSTSPELVHVIIRQLEAAGISRKKIVIWDRREFEMAEVGFTPDAFPGVKLVGTEQKDAKGSFVDADGHQYGERMIDKEWYYWADVEEKYDSETLPYMINEGKNSYFSRICTKDVDCIINVPILKNAGPTVTLCLKNLAFGAISNTGRLHKQLWSETCAEVPAFPPLRDKVVLNIVDGIRGCYQGGPAADQRFICNFNTLLVGSDPVAVDRIGYDIVLKKRFAEKIQKEESPKGRQFLDLAQAMRLGTADLSKITVEQVPTL
jgi:uncharacterized protein (DUF362 family)